VPAVQFGLHVRGDVDAVDDEVLHVPGKVHVDEERVDDLDVAQVTVEEAGAGQVGHRELGVAEAVVVAGVVIARRPAVRAELRRHQGSLT
jgi:hypothetical protein